MRVAFRVDASATIGLGHLQRCLALAQALEVLGVSSVFVTRDMGMDSAALVGAAGFEAHVLRAPRNPAVDGPHDGPPHAAWAGIPQAQDAAEVVELLGHSGVSPPTWVVVDHYALDAHWHGAVSDALGLRVAVIDDLADRLLRAELLIDPNFVEGDHHSKYRACIGAGCRVLGGPRYALLSPGYADAPRYLHRDVLGSIGIFLGGTDPGGLSEQVLLVCREQAAYCGPIELVTTSYNPRCARLRALVGRWPRTTLTLDLPDLTAFFARHDLQIGAGGGATWERCCIGSPSVLLVAAINQLAVVPALEKLGVVATIPVGEVQGGDGLGHALRSLIDDAARRRALGERARALVDGLGARRVALALAAHRLRVRRATAYDGPLLYRWRNDSVTRALSSGAAEIAPQEHNSWLAAAVNDPTKLLLVGEVGEIPVGAIRFDRGGDDSVVVSIYLDPALQGLGLGRWLLSTGEAAAVVWAARALRFTAVVLEGNQRSRHRFESAGYRFVGGSGHKHGEDASRLSLRKEECEP